MVTLETDGVFGLCDLPQTDSLGGESVPVFCGIVQYRAHEAAILLGGVLAKTRTNGTAPAGELHRR